MLPLLRSYLCDHRGVAAVEAALIFPIFATFALAAIDTSNYLMQSHRIENGLSMGGAYLGKAPAPDAVTTLARNMAVTGQSVGGSSRVPGWSVSDINVSFHTIDGEFRTGDRGRIATLATDFNYEGLGFLKAIMGGTLTISAFHEERVDL